MLDALAEAAAEQGYRPDSSVCATKCRAAGPSRT